MLCKFIPNTHRHWVAGHRYPEGGYYGDLELRTKFMRGLPPSIRKELLSPIDQYNTIHSVVDAANRFESQFPPEGRNNRSDTHALATGGNLEEAVDGDGPDPGADWVVECNSALCWDPMSQLR